MKLKFKDQVSAITHLTGCLMAALSAIPLLIRAARYPDTIRLASLAVFIVSMILLYGASAIYHTLDISRRVNQILRKIDHMMIFILIAGTYTPVCSIAIRGTAGRRLLILVWSIAAVGILIKALWISCPKWFSSLLYIGMGWVCVFAFAQIFNSLPAAAFGWLLAGGVIYTVGGVIYALKLPVFNQIHKTFGSHEIFHLFVMGGSICHFILMYSFVSVMPVH